MAVDQQTRARLWAVAPLGIAAVAVAVVLFGAPLAKVLALGVFLLCPLLMMGAHGRGGGHGGHGGHGRAEGRARGGGADGEKDER